jgi:hypothetical protein
MFLPLEHLVIVLQPASKAEVPGVRHQLKGKRRMARHAACPYVASFRKLSIAAGHLRRSGRAYELW